MGWRVVVIKNRAKLDYKMDYLVVRTEDTTTRIHLSEISFLLIESTAVSLTAYLLSELCKQKIKVIFCDEKCSPQSELCAYYGSHDTSEKIRRQIGWNPETKKLVWAEIVRAKITGQASLLPETATRERTLLSAYIREIVPGDPTNREGHAAKVYFNALFGREFSRNDEDVRNAALDYGYGVLLSAFNREIVSCGYLTQLGIFHDNMFNHFNLSCDFMEPFRPFVDHTVCVMTFGAELTHEDKMRLTDVLNQKIRIRDSEQYLAAAIGIYTRSALDALNENDPEKIQNPVYLWEA